MLKPKAPSANEMQEVYQFLNSQLRKDLTWSVQQEYPLAFDPKNSHNIRILKEQDTVVSHAVLKTVLLKTPYAIFNVGMIGSVVTNPNYRHQGLSSQILESCIEEARQQNCDFIILWTDAFDFYRKFGFELAGTEVSLIINSQFAPARDRSDLKIIKSQQIDPQALLRLYNLHTVTSVRTPDDIKKCLHIPNSRIYTAWNKNNQIEAYAIEGKGVDLQGYIHEWGGGTSALMHLFKHIHIDQQKEVIAITPPHCKNLIAQATACGAQKYEGILGMFKIINPAEMAKKTQRIARRMGLKDFAIQYHEEHLYFGSSEGLYKTNSESDMVHLFFGPQKPSEIHQFSERTAATLNRVFPLPCWIWGWDSI